MMNAMLHQFLVCRAAGSPTVNLQWLTMNLNGQFYGLFSALTKIDQQYLQVPNSCAAHCFEL